MSFALLFSLSTAHADIGPPPSCPTGTYRIYHYGYRCIKNGYVLVKRDGRWVEVKEEEATLKPTSIETQAETKTKTKTEVLSDPASPAKEVSDPPPQTKSPATNTSSATQQNPGCAQSPQNSTSGWLVFLLACSFLGWRRKN